MKLAIIGDFRKENATHKATNSAISHSLDFLNAGMEVDWVSTARIPAEFDQIVKEYQGFLISPGSPYASMEGVLNIIRFARENNIPTLGTCGGFQHMVIEFARNVLDIKDAEHAETNPYASRLLVTPLSCSLVGQSLEVHITDRTSKTYALMGRSSFTENYYCNFGLNPEYQDQIHRQGFHIVASDPDGEVRVLELAGHDFFIGTLFVPQANSRPEEPHLIVTGFLTEILGMGLRKAPSGA
jgi:CTP synthase (UTP-ammonia lyase)